MADVNLVEPVGVPPGDAMAARLKSMFAGAGYQPVDPPMMMPAEVVLDRMGENLRRRLLLITSPDGREMCLRPDFTIPVAAGFLEARASSAETNAKAARLAYAGLAFRFPSSDERTRTTAEFRQAGIEYFGGEEAEASDAEVLSASLSALKETGLNEVNVTMGDVALFSDLVCALNLSDGRKKKILRGYRKAEFASDLVADMSVPQADAEDSGRDAAFAKALSSMDANAAQAVIEEVMEMAGTKPVGGRTSAEIAHRFVEQAQITRDGPLEGQAKALLQRYLKVAGTPQKVAAELKGFAKELPELSPAIDRFQHRLDLIEQANIDLASVNFDASFSGRIDYYTGMVFDIRSAQNPDLGIIASGGRYDGFLSEMGASDMIPAVGASIYVDRLVAALSQPGEKP